jgi:membrane-associated HD superfamily phosphohydrolase
VEKTTYIHDTVIMKHIVSDTVMDSAIVIKNNIVYDTVLIVQTKWAKAEASLKEGKLSVQLIQKDTIIYDTVRIETQTNINTFKNEGSNTTKNIIFVIISTFLFIIAVLLLIKKLIR